MTIQNLEYMVLERRAQMPGSCKYPYVYLALVLVDKNSLPDGRKEPAMISARARGVVDIVSTTPPLSRSYGPKSALTQELAVMQDEAKRLNDSLKNIKGSAK